MATSPITLTGTSQYSADFQKVLDRAVQIASIPLRALQNRDADLLQQKTLLSSLNGTLRDLSNSLSALGTVAGNRALSAVSSDASAVSVTVNGVTTPVAYTIDSITSIATVASERTNSGYADSAATPVSSTGTVKLVVGSEEHEITLANNNLISLRDQINALGAGVTASILTTSGGNYLHVAANTTGATTLELRDDPSGANTNLLTQTNQGSDAVFSLNGIPVEQKGNVVNGVIPGVTLTLLKSSNAPVTLTISSDRAQLASALDSFVSSYNTTRDQLNAQVGPAAGLLSGSNVVTQLQGLLRQVAGYRGDEGTVRSLSDLGVTFDSSGKASFDRSAFNALSNDAITDAFDFVGSATSGLSQFAGRLNQFSNPISGLIRLEQQGIDRADQHLQSQITVLEGRISTMQDQLSKRLALAESLNALLESQQTSIKASLQSLNLVLFGKQSE